MVPQKPQAVGTRKIQMEMAILNLLRRSPDKNQMNLHIAFSCPLKTLEKPRQQKSWMNQNVKT